jgi:predicted secreted hydrolase
MRDKKARRVELASNIRRSQLPDAAMIKELLGLFIDDVKDSLVSSMGDETIRLQGEAQAFTRLLTMLTREPPTIAKGE